MKNMSSDEYLKAVDAVQNVNNTDELLKLGRIIKEQFSHATREESLNFKIGDEVTFKGKDGSILKGEVIKINHKTINVVINDFMRYRISPSLLTKV